MSTQASRIIEIAEIAEIAKITAIAAIAMMIVLAAWGAAPARAEWLAQSPKIALRTRNGLLSNAGSAKGGGTTLGGLNPIFNYFPIPWLSLNLAYNMDFDYANGRVLMSGFSGGARWYFLGNGTHSIFENTWDKGEVTSRRAFYFSADISQQSYFIGTAAALALTTESTGNFKVINAGIGMDWSLSRNWEINTELGQSVLSFAGSDDRFRIQGTLFYLGVGYVW